MKKMRRITTTGLLAVILCLALVVSAFASSGFHAGVEVTKESNKITVVIQDSSVLQEQVPVLSIQAEDSFENAVVLFGNTATKVTYADGKVSFKVASGGTYYIVTGAVLKETIAATCVESGKNTYIYEGAEYVETIAATGHDFSDTSSPTCANCSEANPNYGVTGVSLDQTCATLDIGDTVTLIATVESFDAANKAVTWTSSNESVATVENGVVTALKDGTATITVITVSGGFTATCEVTVYKRTPVVTAPTTKNGLTYTGKAQSLVNAGSTIGGTLQYSLDNTNWSTEIPTATDAGTYTVYYRVVGDSIYHDVAAQSITVTISMAYVPSTGGGSATTEPSKPTESTETTINKDGSTTVTETKKDGAVVVTTTYTDGSSTTTESKTTNSKNIYGGTTSTTTTSITSKDAEGNTITRNTVEKTVEKKDGSSTTTTTTTTRDSVTGTTVTSQTEAKTTVAADGTKTTTSVTDTKSSDGSHSKTTVDADGKSETNVTVSAAAAKEAVEENKPFTLPMTKVVSTKDSTTAPIVTVDLPTDYETMTVELPIENLTAGTVVVIVDKDGNETVLGTTRMGENGVIGEISDGATIRIVDNAKDFEDIRDSAWYCDAIDYVSSRGIVKGMTDDTYDYNGVATRAQLWTMLARMDGVDTDAGDGKWYETAQQWAIENGISDGTNPNAEITREQLVTMLWRYVGKPESNQNISGFPDANSISDWATIAVQWANESNVMNGDGSNLDPQGDATRAQLAQFIMNFMENAQ